MRLLSFDTSSEALSLAVSVNGTILTESHTLSTLRHSSALIPAIERILKEAEIRIQDVDVFAVGLGPGSFTGIRVAVVTAKMLAYALDKKIVGVSSLEAIARKYLSPKRSQVAVLLDARKSKVYAGAYTLKKGKVYCVAKPALKDRSDISRYEKMGYHVITEGEPQARWVAEAGHDLAVQKKFVLPERLGPEYLHPRDCNVTLKK